MWTLLLCSFTNDPSHSIISRRSSAHTPKQTFNYSVLYDFYILVTCWICVFVPLANGIRKEWERKSHKNAPQHCINWHLARIFAYSFRINLTQMQTSTMSGKLQNLLPFFSYHFDGCRLKERLGKRIWFLLVWNVNEMFLWAKCHKNANKTSIWFVVRVFRNNNSTTIAYFHDYANEIERETKSIS